MRLRLTEPAITAALKRLNGARGELTDTLLPGLRLRVGASGGASWVLGVRDADGRPRRVALGRWPDLGIAAAREAARQARVAVRAGARPIEEAREKRAQGRDATAGVGTLSALVDTYGRHRGEKLRTWPEQRRRIHSVFAGVMDQPLARLDRLGLQRTADGHPGQQSAAAAVRYVRPVLKWAARRGFVSSDLAGIEPPAPVRRRDRVLSRDELARLLPVLRADTTGYGRLYRFLLLTLARREEAAGARWRDIDLDRGTWTIEASRSKNARAHVVALSRQALALLGEAGEPSALIFGSRTGLVLGNHDRGTRKLSSTAGVTGWTRHDLRRSGATLLGEAGEPPHLIESALNHMHVGGALAALYNRSRYGTEVAAALQRLADMLDEIEDGARTGTSPPIATLALTAP